MPTARWQAGLRDQNLSGDAPADSRAPEPRLLAALSWPSRGDSEPPALSSADGPAITVCSAAITPAQWRGCKATEVSAVWDRRGFPAGLAGRLVRRPPEDFAERGGVEYGR